MNLGDGGDLRSLLTVEGLLGGALFLLMFGFVPIGGGIAMFILTRRALRRRRRNDG